MLIPFNAIIFPFIGEVNLSSSLAIVFAVCIFAVVCFEFVNGFHDTANAVATVIYTKSLKPFIAIPWSAFWNFMGVFLGGVSVAMGILKLVPLNELMLLPVEVGACMVLAVLLASIFWNLSTWYFGIPNSSSHTMIGAIIGATLGLTWYYGGKGVNWHQAEEIGLSLIISPLIGFGLSLLLMMFLKRVVTSKQLFQSSHGKKVRPPIFIRLLLITTCTLVSFFHGSNDGQKGVGLLMLIMIAFLPVKFAINHSLPNAQIIRALNQTEQVLKKTIPSDQSHKVLFLKLDSAIGATKTVLSGKPITDKVKAYKFRELIQKINTGINTIKNDESVRLSAADQNKLMNASIILTRTTDFAPIWVIATISISLGLGTMIGWKRIVVTIGENIGKKHLSYAQGATAEIVAATTIGLGTGFGLPVSTTHVLSSGVAGAMVASGGTKNVNVTTLKNIALAWVLTLPVAIVLSLLLFLLFHALM